jgi:heme o synthase
VFGNIITVSGGFFLGSAGAPNLWLFLATVLGISFIMAGGCAFNNFVDRDIDKLMERTKNRASARGLVAGRYIVLFSLSLALIGGLTLHLFTNSLTLSVALVGLVFYAGFYSLWFKRHSVFGTAVGSISGAVPPVVGYCAATNRLDLGALLLFLILCLWQMPHSYAIAIYRLNDYVAANIPVLPVKKGVPFTKVCMVIYVAIFAVLAVMPSIVGVTGVAYFVVALVLSCAWLFIGIRGLAAGVDDHRWARKMFLFSIIIIMGLSLMMSISY